MAVSYTVWIAYNIAWGVCCCESSCCKSGPSGCYTVQMLLGLFGLQVSTSLAWAAQDGFDAKYHCSPSRSDLKHKGDGWFEEI